MADTSKYTAYKNQFQKEKYDRVNLIIPKGQKSEIQSHAIEHSESLNSFINRAITETIERDKQKASE